MSCRFRQVPFSFSLVGIMAALVAAHFWGVWVGLLAAIACSYVAVLVVDWVSRLEMKARTRRWRPRALRERS